jgi:hypothetical protein
VGAAAWVWADASTAVQACATGAPVGIGPGGLLILAILPPIATAWLGWRGGASRLRIGLAMLTSLALTVFLIWAALQVWWVGHGCYA